MTATQHEVVADLGDPTAILAWALETGDIPTIETHSTCGCLLFHFFDRKYPGEIAVIDTVALHVGQASVNLDRLSGHPQLEVDEGDWGQKLVKRHWATVLQDRLMAAGYTLTWAEAAAVLEALVSELGAAAA
jgi:hypothetical protein